MRPLKIFTWHVHGSYLYYLAQIPHEIYIPVNADRSGSCLGRTSSYPWPDNLKEIPIEQIKNFPFDCILYQSAENYLVDRHHFFSKQQLAGPQIFLEHDPPRLHPTDTRHPVDDPNVLVVHVTAFNQLMWDCGRSPTLVIEHGVMVPEGCAYSGELARGLVVVNNLKKRGRRLGLDIYEKARRQVDLDLVGMGWHEVDGFGEIPHAELFRFAASYRFFFNPIRYTSLGLAVCEAMMVGLPIIGLATTEMVTVIENGRSGFLHTRPEELIDIMKVLIQDPSQAQRWGEGARQVALERFSIRRFARDWCQTLAAVRGHSFASYKTMNINKETKLWQGALQ